MTSWADPMGLVKVALWYSGATTGAQSGRASGSPCTARVEKPRRRFTPSPARCIRARRAPSDASPGPYKRPTPIPGALRARRCAGSRLGGPLLGYDDEHLGARERREAILQGHVVVPLGHDRDAGRPAADRDLAVPTGQITAAGRRPPAPGPNPGTAGAPAPRRLDSSRPPPRRPPT